MFIETLYIIAKNYKQPRCPLTGDWTKNCGIFIQWNTSQKYKRTNYRNMY